MWNLLARAAAWAGARIVGKRAVSSGATWYGKTIATGGLAGGGTRAIARGTGIGSAIAGNSFWIVPSLLNEAGKLAPQVSQTVSVIAVGFPWSRLNEIYQFAISVASGIYMNNISSEVSTKFIQADINHTDKIIKITLGFMCSGLGDAALTPLAAGSKLMDRPVESIIAGGPWPKFMRDNGHPEIVKIRSPNNNELITVTGATVAMDTPGDNSILPYGNGMYGQNDMLLQAPPYGNPCEVVPAPKTNITLISQDNAFQLLGII